MKKYLYFISSVVLALGFTSCKKNYLDTAPTDAVSEADAFTTTAGGWSAINGIHRSLYSQYSNQNEGGQGSVMIHMDMLGEDLVMTSAGNGWFNTSYQWVAHRNVNSTDDYFIYRFYYKIISNANKIIDNIDKATGSDADKKAIKGEALTYRAWAHFQLVQLYGKRYNATAVPNNQLGVPVLTSFNVQPQARSSVEEVYTQINKDLADAITSFTSGATPRAADGISHFNVDVAKGMRARVALTMQDWATAAQYAGEARASYTLMDTTAYLKGFNSISNPEWMWGSKQIPDQTTYFYSFFAYMSANFNSTNIRTNPKAINSKLYGMISSTDIRKKLWDPTGNSIPVPPGGVKAAYANRKFLAVSSSSSIGDVPMMRAAEMYLIEAEARARMGQDAQAQDLLYKLVHARDAAYIKSTNTGTALIDEILTQRRIELWGEGFRFLDLKRLNQPLDRNGANHNVSLASVMSIPAGDNRWEFLFPQAEINANAKVQQNPL